VVPVVLLVLLAVLIVGDPGRIDRQKTWLRVVTGIVIAFITVASLLAAVRLVVDILTSNKLFAHNPTGLLATGGVVWVTNVIAFGLWYWDLDRGGAAARAHHPDRNPAFVFPEMLHPGYAGADWVPHFSDQAMGQGPHDARSGRVDRPGRARDWLCGQPSVVPRRALQPGTRSSSESADGLDQRPRFSAAAARWAAEDLEGRRPCS
jgi:hypothetical protein